MTEIYKYLTDRSPTIMNNIFKKGKPLSSKKPKFPRY